jgi:glycosyltransferase involved in cell wall biosynthesis
VSPKRESKEVPQRPLQVLVFSPPLDRSGGIGALFTYAKPHFPREVEVTFIDTRGYHKSPLWSILQLFKAIFTLLKYRFLKEIDVVHLNLGARGSAFRKIIIGTVAIKLLQIPTVFQLHAATFEDFFKSLPLILRRWMLLILNNASKILVLGSVSKSMMERIGCKSHLLEDFQMGVPDLSGNKLSTSHQNRSNERPRKCPVILFAGELGERKGLPQTLESFKLLEDNIPYLIVAGGGDIQMWQTYATSLKIDHRVSFVGLIPYSAIHSYLTEVDAVILPSRAEGLPVSVLECLSAGKTPIVTLSGNLGDYLDPNNSIIISNPSEVEITHALTSFAELFRLGLCHDIERSAKKLWAEYFDVTKTTLNLARIWKSSFTKEQG